MARLVDLFLVYQFIARLVTPFDQWDAFRLGIIDEKGKVLKKRNTLTTQEERNAWGYFDILATNIKKILQKVPGGESKLVSYAAAGLLLREQDRMKDMSEEDIEKIVRELLDELEEEPANVAGSGNIAGIGVGQQGEPPGKVAALLKAPLRRRRREGY